jgi:hypothetical protein
VWRHGLLGGGNAAARVPGHRPARARWGLHAKLAAVALCLAAAAAGAITVAGRVVAEDFLMRQADQQLRGYAGLLTSRPFTLFPGSRLAPGASVLGAAGRTVSIGVRAPGGQLLISAGPAAPPAGRRGWLELSEPVRYQEDHIPFVYGAEDSSFSVTGTARPGFAGTLVVGMDVAGVGRAVGGLTASCLAVSGLVLLLLTGAAAGVTRALLRPATLAAGAGAATAGAAVRELSGRGAATCREMRRPLSILAALAEHQRERAAPGTVDAERTLGQIAHEAAVISALIDELEAAARGEPPPARRKAVDGDGGAGQG